MRFDIHHGAALVSNVGSPKRSDYMAIGYTVNKTTRIEGACEPGEVFVFEEVANVYGEEDGEVEKVRVFSLKGIQVDETLYRLVK